MKNPLSVPEILEGLNSAKADTKYGCVKALRLVSEQRPEVLYRISISLSTSSSMRTKSSSGTPALRAVTPGARGCFQDKFAAIFKQ